VNPIRPTKYFRHVREDVLAQVPATARTVLDLGCGAGALGERLRQRQPCEVWGIECDPDAAREARGRLDHVIEAGVNEAAASLPAAHFDTLIAADVLEHLADPFAALRALAPSLAPGATVVISLPNIQHHSVVRDLLRGQFTYVPAGILDQTHLRFFTRASALELVRRAGFTVEQVVPLYVRRREGRAARRHIPPRGVPVPAGAGVEDFYPAQFLIVARAAAPPPDTRAVRVSIVMLTWNQLSLTQQAIASIRSATRQPYELIVVDNGSTDGTVEYLDGLAAQGVRVIKNRENRGVAAGWNQGLHAATGDCVMVVNNDVIVAAGWLERMTQLAYTLPHAGLVGCRVSAVSGPQMLAPDYERLEDFPLFARRYAELADGSWFELPRIVAVVMLWRREVYERVGDFDEQFSPSDFEDDDYSVRTLRAGYRNVVANDVFIHHIGSASHPVVTSEVKARAKANGERFRAKWGPVATPVLALRAADYDAHIALLRPDQHALPGWAIPEVRPQVLARYLAKVGRHFGRYGWRAESLAAFRQSLHAAVTVQGVAGLLWNARPRVSVSSAAVPRASRSQ
jgi:GT2 family glycosyltransferase/2-polyprenyl-3-methyl-5-hydroxy-6-metoxy-1,4-benzoquinol methylase